VVVNRCHTNVYLQVTERTRGHDHVGRERETVGRCTRERRCGGRGVQSKVCRRQEEQRSTPQSTTLRRRDTTSSARMPLAVPLVHIHVRRCSSALALVQPCVSCAPQATRDQALGFVQAIDSAEQDDNFVEDSMSMQGFRGVLAAPPRTTRGRALPDAKKSRK
jgi:hypothetical protein